MLLLDTHVWIWSVDDDTRRLGRRARQRIGRADAQDLLRLSPVSIFEVMALHTAGRLRLSMSIEQWIRESVEAGLRVVELTPSMAIDAGSIPRAALADPLDRLLVATARELGAAFLTADTAILEYAGGTGNVRVLDARD